MAKKIKIFKPGDFIKIDMQNGTKCFARILKDPLMAFYDYNSKVIPSLEELELKGILFKIWAYTKAENWNCIGNLPLHEDLLTPVKFFKQDMLNKKLTIYFNSKEYPAKKEECINLECAAVWSSDHVEDRLQDHFNGVPNKWIECMKIKD